MLEFDTDTAARGVSEGLPAWPCRVAVKFVLFCKLWWGGRKGGGDGRGSTRDPPVRQEDVAAVHAADDGGRHCVDVENWGRECVCVCAFARECGKVLRAKARNVCSERNVFAF